MADVRCLIDSMVFDAVAAEPGLSREIDRLTSARRLELLAALPTMAEIGATPDPSHRRALQRVRVLVVPPPAGDGGMLRRLAAVPGVSEADARIALTAVRHAVPLVTEDRGLRHAAAAHLPELPVWTWAGDLRPRVAALSRRHPPPARRR